MITTENIIIFSLTVLFLTAFLVFLFIKKRKKKKTLEKSMEMTLFSVRMPRYGGKKEDGEKETRKELISKMEQFFSNFLSINKDDSFFSGPTRVVFEIATDIGQGDISFYVAVPSKQSNLLKNYIHGVYSEAVMEKVPEDYTIFEPGGEVSISFLTQKETFFVPINTYEDLGRDPLEAIINSISSIEPSEGAAVQIIIRPSSVNLRKKGEAVLEDIINKKKKLEEAVKSVLESGLKKALKEVLDIFISKKEEEKKEEKAVCVDETIINSIREKIKKPGFDVNIRLVGAGQSKEEADEILENIEGSFSQFQSSFNGFRAKRIKNKKQLSRAIYNFSFRIFKKEENIVLNSSELASIYHFPLSSTESPNIKWVKSNEAPTPSELPKEGPVLIGESVYRGEKEKIYIASKEDRRRHFYIIGQTGVGKSKLLSEMIRQDIENGEGVGVIDPHGDLIEETLSHIPKERVEDVVLFEPFDREMPCGLNMLEWKDPEQRDFAISEMIMIFSKLFPPEMVGPVFEYYMRNAMLALMSDIKNQGTIAEIPRIFTDEKFMEEKAKNISNPLIRNFWLVEWKQMVGQSRSELLGYVLSKIGRFVTDEMMRNIIGQQKSSFDLAEIMDEKKIFLANLSKGLTGELNSSLLGMILVSKMQITALQRARKREEERNDFYLYIDEFQNFTTDSVATILSEARKYKLNLILAHQYVPQLQEDIKNAVMGNVGSIASFRVGPTDAEFLENHFSPEFSKFDLGNIDNRQYILRMMVNGKIASPFKLSTINAKKGDFNYGQKVKELSKLKYGRPKEMVEESITERAKFNV